MSHKKTRMENRMEDQATKHQTQFTEYMHEVDKETIIRDKRNAYFIQLIFRFFRHKDLQFVI